MSSSLTMRRIKKLDTRLANQIAAGEVVERPASVVKELLENSIDAGAQVIQIDIENAGMQQIKIRDDGHGIHPDDLMLAVAPHATSKVYSLNELEEIRSLGFRGEALASIASVSRFRLTSLAENQTEALTVECQGKDMMPVCSPASHPLGTTVEVQDLFYNIPARRKFLKSEATEREHIDRVIRRIALRHFDVAFHYRYQGKSILRLPSAVTEQQREQRILQLCSAAFIENCVFLDVEASGLRLWGWLSQKNYSISHNEQQYFFVNGRIVKDKLLTHALKQAYHNHIPEGRFPVFILNLDVDPKFVDVNVHPTKHEVRFRDSRYVHDFLSTHIMKALHSSADANHGALESPTPHYAAPSKENYSTAVPKISEPKEACSSAPLNTVILPVIPEKNKLSEVPAQLIGFLFKRYFLVEYQSETWILDVYSVNKVATEARLKLAFAKEGISRRPLLWPEDISFNAENINFINHSLEILQQFGWILTPAGIDSMLIREVPEGLANDEISKLLRKILETLLAVKDTEAASSVIISQIASSITWSELQYMTEQECLSLWREFMNAAQELKCPPKELLRLTPQALEKLFAQVG